MKNPTNYNVPLSKIGGSLCISILVVLFLFFIGCVTTEVKKTPLSSLAGEEKGRIYYESSSPHTIINILDGVYNDPKAIVYGDLKFPKNTQGKVPAIVFVHGGGGWQEFEESWLRELSKMGIATFRTDSYRPRGIRTSVPGIARKRVQSETMIADVYNALKLLSTHPRIDKERIGIMGGSTGGLVSLLTAWEPIRQAMVNEELKFALHVPIYPLCFLFAKIQMTGAPILILIGEKDNWTAPQPCVELIKELKDAGYDADIIIYPGAYHGFDELSPVRKFEGAYSAARCRFKILPNGRVIETTCGSGKKCRFKGPLSGGNPAAKKKSMKDMKEFVSRVFGL